MLLTYVYIHTCVHIHMYSYIYNTSSSMMTSLFIFFSIATYMQVRFFKNSAWKTSLVSSASLVLIYSYTYILLYSYKSNYYSLGSRHAYTHAHTYTDFTKKLFQMQQPQAQFVLVITPAKQSCLCLYMHICG